MRIVFFGTPDFAAQTLKFLIDNQISILAAVTKPDLPKGRSGVPVASPVKKFALEHQIPLYQPHRASSPEFIELMSSFQPDLFIVVAYGEIMKQSLLDVPSISCVNVHASLLPKYRGAAPIERAIINGEKETGVTIMHMILKMDAGEIIAQEKVPIGENMTALELRQQLCEVGSKLLLKVINNIKTDRVHSVPQDESQMTLAPKIELEDCLINWSNSAQMIHNLVRGTYPHPGAWTWIHINNEKKRLKVLNTRVEKDLEGEMRQILKADKEGISIACGEGVLRILNLQLEGKRPMTAREFLSGYDIRSIDII